MAAKESINQILPIFNTKAHYYQMLFEFHYYISQIDRYFL